MGVGVDGEEFARTSEALGADALAWGESPTQFHDPYLSMALTAKATDRVLLGTVMTCPGLRHPATLANTFLELQRISGGRIFCGIGTGDLALIEMGEKPFSMDDFVEYSRTLRGLMAGETVTWNGNTFRIQFPIEQSVPVWYGADGPRGIHAAGQFADGII